MPSSNRRDVFSAPPDQGAEFINAVGRPICQFRQAAAEWIEEPTDDDLRRLELKRKGKKVSNEDWERPSNADSRMTKVKEGSTRLAYKTESAVDLETEAIVADAIGIT